MAYTLKFLALCCALAPPTSADIISGPIVNPANGHWYYLLSHQTWDDAEAEAQSLGGNLVTINDAAENLWLLNTFAAPNRPTVWIGYNDVAVNGTFVWSSGQTPSYTNWGSGEPNNGGGSGFAEDFGLLLLQNQGSLLPGDWNDGRNSSFGIAEVVAVPEPSSALLLLLSGGLIAWRYRKNSCTGV